MLALVKSIGTQIVAAARGKPRLTGPLTMANIIRPQARERWMLPQLGAITPQYIEMTLRGALAGAHVPQWELLNLMEDSWPRLRKNVMEIKTAVRNREMLVEAYREDDEEETSTATERMKLVSAALRRWQPDPAADEGGFADLINDILDAWFKGTSVIEINWSAEKAGKLGQIIAPKVARWVHPANYAWDENLRLGLALNGDSSSKRVLQEFSPEQFIIAKYKSKSGSILGGALLRPLVWWWCAANFSADWLLNLAQIFGLPFRWASYDPTAPQETVDRICSMLQNMGSAGWAAFPTGTSMELLADGTKSGSDTPQGDMLDRADKQCDLLVLGQTLTSDTGGMGAGGGSKALGEVHADVRSGIIDAAAKFAASVIESQLIPSILRLNYGDTEEAPTLKLAAVEDDDLDAKATMLATLVTAGAGSIIGKDWLGKTFDIPKPMAGEETLEKIEPLPAKGTPGTSANGSAPDADLKARAERLESIEDDAVFAREFAALLGRDVSDEARDNSGKWTVGAHTHKSRESGDIEMRDATPEERKALAIPPAYGVAKVPVAEGSPILWKAQAPNGKIQLRRSETQAGKQLQAKHERGKMFSAELPEIKAKWENEIASNGSNHHEAKVLRLVHQTGFRNGGEGGGGKVAAYGASSLRGEHVTVEGDKIHFMFPGKGGHVQDHELVDPVLAKHFAERKAAGEEKMFDTNDSKVREYLHSVDGDFIVHDFRTHAATRTAAAEVEKQLKENPPKNAKEAKAIEKAALVLAARKIGDTVSVAKSTYVNPQVFEKLKFTK